MKLYELTDHYRELLDQLSEPREDGHEEEGCRALLKGLGEVFDEKVLSIAKVVRSMDTDVAAIAAEVNRLQARRRHLVGRVDWLKRYLLGEMEAAGRTKVRGSTLTVALVKAPPSCEVANVDDIAGEFRRVKIEADRAGILEHFRSTGEVVPGTTVIADRLNLRIS